MEQQAQAQLSAAMIKQLFMGMGALSKAFYQKYGKAALPVITGVMSQGGVETGKMMQQMAPAKSMKDVGESFKMMGSVMGMGMDVTELSDKVFHFKTPRCPLGIEGTSQELCEALMTMQQKMISTVLGKEVDMKMPKSVAAGDKECDVIFSIK